MRRENGTCSYVLYTQALKCKNVLCIRLYTFINISYSWEASKRIGSNGVLDYTVLSYTKICMH